MKILAVILILALSAFAADPAPPPAQRLTAEQMALISLSAKDSTIAQLQSRIADLTRELVLAQACAGARLPIEDCIVGGDGTITAKVHDDADPAKKPTP